MPSQARAAPASAYLLADNLDAALAAGEDLLACVLTWNAGSGRWSDEIARRRREQRQAVEEIRSIEMILVARMLKSRERAEYLAKKDERFTPIARLYSASTALLIEAVNEFGDATVHDFETGDAMTAYLRTRGLIAPDAPAPGEGETLAVTEEFLIAQRIRLGTLLDLAAAFLDTLELRYDLYDEDRQPVLEIQPGEADPNEALV